MAKPCWFPFYPGDFLASSRVALMTTEEIGCYILLLCHAWQDPMCSLQNNDEILKKLSRFSGNLEAVKACFTQKNGRLVNKRMYGEWVKSKKIRSLKRKAGVIGMLKRWGNSEITPVITDAITKNNQSQSQSQLQKEEREEGMQGDARSVQKRSRAALCDVEWVQSLKENPAYTGIDIDLEHKKASVWYPAHNRQLTRRSFVNWLIKAMSDKPILEKKDTSTCQERVQRGQFLKPCGEPSVVQIGGQPRCQTHKEAYESRISRTAT